MTNQVNQYERHMAIQEAYQIHDSDEYFKARPQLECGDRRKVFYAGHIRGYQAATQASEIEINALKERVAELQASNNKLREAGQALVERWDSPNWSDGTHTRDYIDALRKALSSTPAQSLAEHEIIKSQRDKLLSSLKLALIEMMALPRSLGLEITHAIDMEILINEVEKSK